MVDIYYALSGNYIGTFDITKFSTRMIKNYIKEKIYNNELYLSQIILLYNDNIINEYDYDIDLMNINIIYVVINQYLNQSIIYYKNNIKYNTIIWFQQHNRLKDISQMISELVNISKDKLKITLVNYEFFDGHKQCTIMDMNSDLFVIEYFYNCDSIVAHI